ncbi:hypothetical protein K474DRAFT_1703004 [Panus rudis PR-1116 ss-1]|nr:hypothetical protein K474DRAFT_1703004 [Panus rudis PR-1116 ss-1]
MTTNTVLFPSEVSSTNATESRQTQDSAVALSHHAAALEICDLVYGATVPSWDAIERFYEPSATYENPFVTATSREVISDIHYLASQFAQIDIPKPVAVLYAILRMQRTGRWSDPWFRALQVWSEVDDVSETDSFNGHRKVIVEHTLHILLLPGLHPSSFRPPGNIGRTPTSSDLSLSHYSPQPTTLGLHITLPSPLHLRLPIITRLQFNDAGRITHHRDFWDVKDLLGLVPGMTLTQWVTGRLLAQGVRGLAGIARILFSSSHASSSKEKEGDEEALSPAQAYANSVQSGNYREPRRSNPLRHGV